MTQVTDRALLKASSSTLATEDDSFASLLRREECHRWMNLLQIIATDLERGSKQTTDAKAQEALKRANAQIQALGVLQQLLGGPRRQETEMLKTVISKLSSAIDTLIFKPRGFVLCTNLDPAIVELRVGAPRMRLLALSLTELLVNVAKHGFNARESEVNFSIRQINGFLVCSIVDQGPGPAGDVTRAGSEGLVLVDAMTRAIGGTCRWVFGPDGTTAEIQVPLHTLLVEFVSSFSKGAKDDKDGRALTSFEPEIKQLARCRSFGASRT